MKMVNGDFQGIGTAKGQCLSQNNQFIQQTKKQYLCILYALKARNTFFKKVEKSCWHLLEGLILYNSPLKTAATNFKKFKRKIKSCWQTKATVIYLKSCCWEQTTAWTLKMKDWTVFKTLKILIKKSPGWTSLNQSIQNKNKPNNSRTV